MNIKYYAGIGSRETPNEILSIMWEFARIMDFNGWILRSGGAQGADTAFELGAKAGNTFAPEIYLPKHILENTFGNANKALALAKEYHPAWNRVKQGYCQALLARDIYQVLGPDLNTPSKFIICWTRLDNLGNPLGGTGQAIRCALDHGIKVINLGKQNHFEAFKKLWVEGKLLNFLNSL